MEEVIVKDKEFYSRFSDIDEVCYAEYLQFFSNLRWLVSVRYKSFSEFSRLLREKYGVTVTDAGVSGYEKGFFKTAQYNWIKAISVFLRVDIHEMMTTDFRECGATRV